MHAPYFIITVGCRGISIYRLPIIIFFYKYRLLDIEIFNISEYRYFSSADWSQLFQKDKDDQCANSAGKSVN
jgi:hypothetical protein